MIWNLETIGIDLQDTQTLKGHTDKVGSVLELPNSLLMSSSFDGTLRLWDLKNKEKPVLTPVKTIKASRQDNPSLCAMTLLNTKELLVAVAVDNDVCIYEIEVRLKKLTRVKRLSGHSNTVTDIKCVEGDEMLILTCGQDLKCKLWDVRSGNCLKTYENQRYWLCSLAVLSREVFAFSSSDIRFFNVYTGKKLKVVEDKDSNMIFSITKVPNGVAYAGVGNRVKVMEF